MASSPTPNPLKRKRESCRSTRIVIELPSKPRFYAPGSGPPLQRISLLPAQDSTAYILERILLPSPGNAADGQPLPKRMTYIVGWHDLPAARMLVPAMQVLDYVSPYALEEWEYQMELELDEDRARMEEEKTQEKPKMGKKRGRPPGHSQIEAVVAELDNEVLKTGRPKSGAMSITTPSKKRMRDFEDISDIYTSPSRQLEEESQSVSWAAGSDLDHDQLPSSKYNSEEPSEIVASQQNTDSECSKQSKNVRKSAKPSGPKNRAPASRSRTSSRQATPKPSTVPASSVLQKETPVPLPKLLVLSGTPVNGATPTIKKPTSSFTPLGRSAPLSPLQFETPGMGVNTPTAGDGAKSKSKPTPKPKLQTKDSAKKPRKKTQKEAVSKETGEPTPEPGEDDHSPTQKAEESVWEVKRVEASELYDVEGVGLVRYFKVLWEGDWPPEMNPSWEPEANLAPELVQEYLKRTKKKPAKKKPQPLRQTTLPWAPVKQYKSVSEAFAGGEDEIDLVSASMNSDGADATHDGMPDDKEEFLVVEEPPTKKHRKEPVVRWDGNRISAGLEFNMVPGI